MPKKHHYELARGNHAPGQGERCAAEWVAYIAGEAHTDRPKTMSAILREFIVWLNDDLPTRQRQKLRPYLSRMIGTAGDGYDDERFVALYEYAMETPVGNALARPVYSAKLTNVYSKSAMFKLAEEGTQYLGRLPAPPDAFYYARMAAAIAASRREIPAELMEDLLPTFTLNVQRAALQKVG